MTDVVERARSASNFTATHGELLRELANEIERLQKVCRNEAGVELSEENDRLIDEIKQLKINIEHLKEAIICRSV